MREAPFYGQAAVFRRVSCYEVPVNATAHNLHIRTANADRGLRPCPATAKRGESVRVARLESLARGHNHREQLRRSIECPARIAGSRKPLDHCENFGKLARKPLAG